MVTPLLVVTHPLVIQPPGALAKANSIWKPMWSFVGQRPRPPYSTFSTIPAVIVRRRSRQKQRRLRRRRRRVRRFPTTNWHWPITARHAHRFRPMSTWPPVTCPMTSRRVMSSWRRCRLRRAPIVRRRCRMCRRFRRVSIIAVRICCELVFKLIRWDVRFKLIRGDFRNVAIFQLVHLGGTLDP